VIKCVECGKHIEYHAYRDVIVRPHGKLKIGDTVGPLCLSDYCKLHAQKLFFVEYEHGTELVGKVIDKILGKLGCTSKDMAGRLGVKLSKFSLWKNDKRIPTMDMYHRIMEIARECGAI
jgi:hypothetical protein